MEELELAVITELNKFAEEPRVFSNEFLHSEKIVAKYFYKRLYPICIKLKHSG